MNFSWRRVAALFSCLVALAGASGSASGQTWRAYTLPMGSGGGKWAQLCVSGGAANTWQKLQSCPQAVTLSISGWITDYNVRTAAIGAGWDQVAPVNITVNISAGSVVGSSSIYSYAFDTGSGYPAGSTITLNIGGGAYITGRGGNGGGGGRAWAGDPGGPALRAQHAITINNGGTIQGGGGGGGSRPDLGWGGGGGGAGYPAGVGGIGGGYDDGMGPNGRPGGLTYGGSQGIYYGGYGGGPGSSGTASQTIGPQPGGAGGYSVVGWANVTWGATGTILGPTS